MKENAMRGQGYLCIDCLKCVHFSEYQTSNGALSRCELDDLFLLLGPEGKILQTPCPACSSKADK